MECLNISGRSDFMLKVQVKDMLAYHEFNVNKLGELDNIRHMESVFVMSVIKATQSGILIL